MVAVLQPEPIQRRQLRLFAAAFRFFAHDLLGDERGDELDETVVPDIAVPFNQSLVGGHHEIGKVVGVYRPRVEPDSVIPLLQLSGRLRRLGLFLRVG